MEREILEARLQQAEWHVALIAQSIHEQVVKIAELTHNGQDDGQARTTLAQLEELFRQHVADHSRLRQDLDGYKDGAESDISAKPRQP